MRVNPKDLRYLAFTLLMVSTCLGCQRANKDAPASTENPSQRTVRILGSDNGSKDSNLSAPSAEKVTHSVTDSRKVDSQAEKSNDDFTDYMEAGLKEYDQWKKFRNDEAGNVGRIVSWRLKTFMVTRSGYVKAYVRNDYHAGVVLTSEYGNPYEKGSLPKVRDDDWLEVTGQFTRLDDEGNVVLEAIEVMNLGVL